MRLRSFPLRVKVSGSCFSLRSEISTVQHRMNLEVLHAKKDFVCIIIRAHRKERTLMSQTEAMNSLFWCALPGLYFSSSKN